MKMVNWLWKKNPK
jgi:hypothetical protein